MANIKSQKKRNRQNERRRNVNSQIKSSIRTAVKKVLKSIDSKESPEAIKDSYLNFVKTVDRASSDGIIHKNNAARKKSRLAKKVNSALQA